MLGTIVNTVAIIVGSILGLLMKGGIKERYRAMVINALGLSTFFMGASTAISGLLDKNTVAILYILSLAIGSLLGEWIDIESRLEHLGDVIQSKFKGDDGNIAEGFVTASLLFCVGSMAILGSLESGISGDYSILFVKSILDGVMAMVFASTLGIGVIFASVAVFIYQGFITIFAGFIQPYMTADMIREISTVGGIMVSVIGLNLLGITKIKIGNMLPAIFIPVVYFLPWVQNLIHMIATFFSGLI